MGACQEIREHLMGYLDQELSSDRRAEVEAHLGECTECAREFAIYRNLKALTARLRMQEPEASQWGSFMWKMNRTLVRGAGWGFFLFGAVVYLLYAGYGLFHFLADPSVGTLIKLAGLGVLIGLLLLLLSVGYERWQIWRTDPYKEVQR